jgi:putative membrane protein
MSENQLITRDYLAIERTRLANERTFLAYFRSTVVFLASGLSIIQLESLREIYEIGWALAAIAPVLLAVGMGRFIYVKRSIRKYYVESQA